MHLIDFPQMRRNVSLKGYCTFGVGGPADYFIELQETEHLPELIKMARAEGIPYFILGGGSNVLFLDEGFPGLVIRMMGRRVEVKNHQLMADAGATWPLLLKTMTDAGLSGLEAMAGLPGTLGGAIRGNAGCFGTEMADVVKTVTWYDPEKNEIRTDSADFFQFGYRMSFFKHHPGVVLRATLRLKPVTPDKNRSNMPSAATPSETQEILQLRATKQPPGKSSGSFFKNPSSDQTAGWLIDQCGLKGLRIGDAQISEKHANFFLNLGQATAADLLALRDRAKQAVHERFGVLLEEEVVIVTPR